MFVHTTAHGRVALWVKVYQQHPLLVLCERGGEVHRGGGFAHTTFLIGDTENLGHKCVLSALDAGLLRSNLYQVAFSVQLWHMQWLNLRNAAQRKCVFECVNFFCRHHTLHR